MSRWYTWNTWLGRRQKRSGGFQVKRTLLPLPGIEPKLLCPPLNFPRNFSLVMKNEFVFCIAPLWQWQDAVEIVLFGYGSISHTAGFCTRIRAVVLIRYFPNYTLCCKHEPRFQITTNKIQRFLIYLFLQTPYKFQAVPPPIIRST